MDQAESDAVDGSPMEVVTSDDVAQVCPMPKYFSKPRGSFLSNEFGIAHQKQ
jgi:hypothetical protein